MKLRRTLPALLLALLGGFAAWVLGQHSSAWSQAAPPKASAVSGSEWQLLSASEKRALAPLAARWGELTPTQRSKWRAIARQYQQLSATEQTVMHERMSEWVALSPTQRNQARLNFNTVQNLPKGEKKTKWDEYQSLTEAQKRELSAGALSPSKTAAPSPKPANAERLVQPAVRTLPPAALPARPPIDQKTLLPLPSPPASEPGPKAAPATEPAASEASDT
ncbi:MAG: hypothetical protein RL559_433 [Pseudomonadota bacterium]